jgi:uncharacterized protein (DUF433 family)
MTRVAPTPPDRREVPIAAEDLRGDLIQRGHPLFGIIWINRERMSGTPCFAGTRVPVRSLFEYLAGGDSIDEFVEDFPGVTRRQVEDVITLAARRLLDQLPGA